jgi:hypothetical protein
MAKLIPTKSASVSSSKASTAPTGGDSAAPSYTPTNKLDPNELKGRRFGRVLAKLGKTTREQVHEGLNVQKAKKEKGQSKRIGDILVELGYIKPEDVMEALAGQAGMKMVHVHADAISKEAFEALPAESANTYQIIPLDYKATGKTLTIAMKSPDNFQAVDGLRLTPWTP